MDREDVVYIYIGILFNHEKEGHPAIYNMGGSWGHYAEISQRKTDTVYHFYMEPKKAKLVKTE